MTDRTWILLLLVPAPLYVAGRFLVSFPLDSAAIPLAFGLTFFFGLATAVGLLRSRWLVWAGEVALLLAVLIPVLPGFPAGMGGLDLAAGVMLGAPFVGLEGAWRSNRSPASRLGTLELSLFLGVWYLAALPAIPSGGSSLSGLAFFNALAEVLATQLHGLLATLTGGVSTAVLPLGNSLDPVYVGLAAFALLGVMITALEPRTALDEPLPWGWITPHRQENDLGPAISPGELREGQRVALASRSQAIAPDASLSPGVASLVLAGFAIVLLVLGAVYLPMYFLSTVTLVMTALVVTVIAVFSRRIESSGVPPSAGDTGTPSKPELPPARPA